MNIDSTLGRGGNNQPRHVKEQMPQRDRGQAEAAVAAHPGTSALGEGLPTPRPHGPQVSSEPPSGSRASQTWAMLFKRVYDIDDFVRRHPEICADMRLWADQKGEVLYDGGPGPIPRHLVVENAFVFLGKFQPINRIDYELILHDFDRLLSLYKYVESHGKTSPVSVSLETHFSFRPGCRTKKRSAIVSQSCEQIKRDFRHNELQKVLYRRLARQFGKDNVGTENRGVNGTSIDLVVRRKRGYWFYEIKTAPSPRECIREALGQLLEYAFWPGAQEAARLVVASEWPIDKGGEDYLSRLKQRFSLPLEYEQIKV